MRAYSSMKLDCPAEHRLLLLRTPGQSVGEFLHEPDGQMVLFTQIRSAQLERLTTEGLTAAVRHEPRQSPHGLNGVGMLVSQRSLINAQNSTPVGFGFGMEPQRLVRGGQSGAHRSLNRRLVLQAAGLDLASCLIDDLADGDLPAESLLGVRR